MSAIKTFILAATAAAVLATPALAVPPKPSVPKMVIADDSGTSNLDLVTNKKRPRFHGTCQSGLRIYVNADNGVNLNWADCTAQGTYEVTPVIDMPDGVHGVKAMSWHVLNQESSGYSSPLNVTIDTTAPAAPDMADLADGSDTGLSNSDNITKQNFPLFYGFGAEPTATLELHVNGNEKASRTGSGSISGVQLSVNATLAITMQQTDLAGNVGPYSPTLNVTVDTAAPTSPNIFLTQGSDSGKSDSDELTRFQSLTFYIPTGGASPRMELFRDGVKVTSGAVGDLYLDAVVPAGDYFTTFKGRETDLAGNVGAFSSDMTVHIDTIAPGAPTMAPDLLPHTDNGIRNYDNLTSASALAFKLKANNESELLYLKRNGAVIFSASRYGSGEVSALSVLGSSTYTVTEFDDAGNESGSSPALTVNVVDGAPTANSDAYTLVAGGTLTIPAPGVIGNDVDFEGKPLTSTKINNPLFGTVTFNADGSFTYVAPAQGTGTDGFNYKVSNGTLESASAGVTIKVVSAVPTVTTLTPSSGSFAANHTLNLAGENYQAGASIVVGNVNLQNVNVSPSEASGTLPAMAFPPGTLQPVTLTNPDDGFATSPTSFMVDFLDVNQAHPFHAFVESIFRAGVTAGCGSGNYCPDNPVTRGQMAVFLLTAKNGKGFVPPPPSGAVFLDVPVDHYFAGFIEKLSADGITAGCGGGKYCPDNVITRGQMAVFLLTAFEGAGYVPPPASGLFNDVPANHIFARWIEELAKRGISSGCGNGNYCPDTAITRGQMAVLLKVTFSLP